MEARQPYLNEDICKKRFQRGKLKDTDKPFQVVLQEKNDKCKHKSFKRVLLTIVLATLIVITYSIAIRQHGYVSHHKYRRHLMNIWKRSRGLDHTYASHSNIEWDEISIVVKKIADNDGIINGIGLLNFNEREIFEWNTRIFPYSKNHIVLHLDSADENVTWDSLYPEWIDEEQEDKVPKCPILPQLDVPKEKLEVIAVKLPCRNQGNWSRDVARLHLQLASAGLAASAKGDRKVHLLFISSCTPIPNLFPCKELVIRRGNAWLYQPNLMVLREKLQLPIASCELSFPFKPQDGDYVGDARREAYVTILHSADVYVCGAITAAQSIRMVGSTRDLVVLVDETVSDYHRSGLESAGWKIRTIQRIRNPKAENGTYNEWNYSKFRLWQLTDYKKIIFIDADMLIFRNIDFLFHMPEISATGNNGTLFNSGVMVIEPSNCTFQLLIDNIDKITSYNGGDQGYLNEIFTWWHRVPKHMNFLKDFWIGDDEETKTKKTRLFGANPPIIYVLHYLGLKPWLCFRDYDCNWNVDILREFASDVAHNNWWKVHDAMPSQLQQFCLLSSERKAQLGWDRYQARKANFTDGLWKVKIQDPRKNICIENLCPRKINRSHDWSSRPTPSATARSF
ncbi:UDP-glucuronate:xylan alpha-glucuronosyltransferase 1-like [Cynara cardunculus var. scolymus]|nr:UDP-glucuronate:xylan alpha-glucuronosyltransferase 1-like [Cynara cardunculus var. scolymus]